MKTKIFADLDVAEKSLWIDAASNCRRAELKNLIQKYGHIPTTSSHALLGVLHRAANLATITPSARALNTLKFLIHEGAPLTDVDDKRMRVTHMCVSINGSGIAKVLEILIREGCELNSFTKQGENELHICARVGNYKATTILLQTIENCNLKSIQGYTPLEINLIAIEQALKSPLSKLKLPELIKNLKVLLQSSKIINRLSRKTSLTFGGNLSVKDALIHRGWYDVAMEIDRLGGV